MSTNYYWKVPADLWLPTGNPVPIDWDNPSIHVGQRNDKQFTWAQDPSYVKALCTRRSQDVLIQDEYDVPLTGAAFLTLLESLYDRIELVGKRFC